MAISQEPTTLEKLHGLRWNLGAAAVRTIFIQLTYFGSVFILFLDELGLEKASIGFVLSLIPFSNIIALFVAPSAARYGYKRTFLIFFGLRTIVTLGLLLTPLVVATLGTQASFWFIVGIVGLFALFRSIGETAYHPWSQEFVPSHVRGKHAASVSLVVALVGLGTVSVASYVIEQAQGLEGFLGLITAGVIAGLIATWLFSLMPGGASTSVVDASVADGGNDEDNATSSVDWQAWRNVLRDRNFTRFLFCLALITLGTVPLASFLPLFLSDAIHIPTSSVILVQMGTLAGTVCSSYLWGWIADRYGSKPVMLMGVAMLVITPLLWLVLPRTVDWRFEAAIVITFIQGLAGLGWVIGSGRVLFVSIVPVDKKTEYLAVFFAWAGVIAGISHLSGGWILDTVPIQPATVYVINLDPYTPLLILGSVLPLISLFLLRPMRTDTTISMVQFANLFFRGNPFGAIRSMLWFHVARSEEATVLTTERMGRTNSPLAVEEILEALHDPRFNVRFEAIITMARMRPDPRIIEALAEVLAYSPPALGVIAAWALGRIGDEGAIPALRTSLTDAPYRSIKAQSARSLGTLGDHGSVPTLLTLLQAEPDDGVRIAYAAALGRLQATDALDEILRLMNDVSDTQAGMKVTLALARMMDNEQYCIQLWREMQRDASTAISGAIGPIKRKLTRRIEHYAEITRTLDQATDAFAHTEFMGGIAHLTEVVALWPASYLNDTASTLLQECIKRAGVYGETRMGYLLLILLVLNGRYAD
ncbi:MAG: MFS transporter [Chloroflexota bacterium]